MSQRIIASPELQAVATPVDRFVRPQMEQAPQTNGLLEIAKSLRAVSPEINQMLDRRFQEYAQREEARGINAEVSGDVSMEELQQNRSGWNQLINTVRKEDGAKADRIAAMSPHFKRGVVKVKAQNAAMGLNDQLAMAYAKNPTVNVGGVEVPIQSVDDPSVVAAWADQMAQQYTEQSGVMGFDPVIVAEAYSPVAARATDSIVALHTERRLVQTQQDALDTLSANVGLSLNGGGDSAAEDFIARLGVRESSSNYSSVNSEGYFGLLQWGDARLADYNRATGQSITKEQFLRSKALQDRANLWHIADIDRVIDEEGYLALGYSRDGLRSVAHLGGIGGMKKFVSTKGQYNPNDAYGTRLSNYYTKFSGVASRVEAAGNEMVANGADPRKVNVTIVDSVIAEAVRTGDASLLASLNEIDSGTGPLGNISWVKKEVDAAAAKIESQNFQTEQRRVALEDRQRKETRRVLQTGAYREILSGDDVDYEQLALDALQFGDPELANSIRTFGKSVQDDRASINTDPSYFSDLRWRISQAEGPDEMVKLQAEAAIAVTAGRLSTSDMASIMDDAETRARYSDVLSAPAAKDSLGFIESTISDRFSIKDVFGNSSGGEEMGRKALVEAEEAYLEWLEENPEARKSERRKALRQIERDILDSPRFNNPEAGIEPPRMNEAPTNTVEIDAWSETGIDPALAPYLSQPTGLPLLQQLATERGLRPAELASQLGITTNLIIE
ncbi:MAG: hypothetical protein AAFQ32_04600 [Pseudomonadota bacterium]